MRLRNILAILISIFVSSSALSAPIWQSSHFIEARNQDIIITNQKVSGFYTYSIVFATTQYSPTIALGILNYIQLYLKLDGQPL
jgi:hypothetical protein